PNFGTNGDLTGNPWWGPFPPNIQVVGAENGITPHSGTNMARGVGFTGPADFDQDYFNLGYRLNNTNGGFGFTGNYFLDWWFYDAVGQGTNGSATNYCDYIALGNYGAVPINTDAPANDSAGNSVSQRMSIGATSNESAGYDSTKYQMRFIGIPGYNGGGWANLPNVRSVGWHHARMEVLPPLGDGTSDAAFYCDDMVNPAFRGNTINNTVNVIELNGRFGTISAYFDDITFDVLPPPTLSISQVGTNVVVTWANSFILQSNTDLTGNTPFSDVLDGNNNYVTSPYTNSLAAGSQMYFRLRN